MKKCALINDLSGFGKCSLMAEIPVLSVMKVQPCPIPTAILSMQTGFDNYLAVDFTNNMTSYINSWKEKNVSFDGIITGYFASEKQIEITEKFIEKYKNSENLVLVDPIMGDNGQVYDNFGKSKCDLIKNLAIKADVITPNVTELNILTGESSVENGANTMLDLGVKTVIVTGIKEDEMIKNAVFTKEKSQYFSSACVFGSFSGTGDLFSSIVMGYALNDNDFFAATKKATAFLEKVLKNTKTNDCREGVDFELFLKEL